jgi:hypothetical protein
VHAHDFTCGGGFSSSGRSNCHKQNGLCGTNRYSDNQAYMKTPWTKNPESNRIAEVVSQGRSMTWANCYSVRWCRLECHGVQLGGWRNRQGTAISPTGIKEGEPLMYFSARDFTVAVVLAIFCFKLLLLLIQFLTSLYGLCGHCSDEVLKKYWIISL